MYAVLGRLHFSQLQPPPTRSVQARFLAKMGRLGPDCDPLKPHCHNPSCIIFTNKNAPLCHRTVSHICTASTMHCSYLSRGMGELCGADMQTALPWPTCKDHYDLTMGSSDFHSWVWNSLYDPHGPVHAWIGGVMDCRDTYKKIGDIIGDDLAKKMAGLSFMHRKNLYRDGFFRCEGTAEISQRPDEVRFSLLFVFPFFLGRSSCLELHTSLEISIPYNFSVIFFCKKTPEDHIGPTFE